MTMDLSPESIDRILFLVAALPGAQEKLVLAKFLAGTHDSVMDATDLSTREGFGVLKHVPLPECVRTMDQLVEGGWFTIETTQSKKEGKVQKLKLSERARARMVEVQAVRLRDALGGSRVALVQVLATTPEKVLRTCLEGMEPHRVRALSAQLQSLLADPAVKHRELIANALRKAGVPGA
jgi:hypothetical protein